MPKSRFPSQKMPTPYSQLSQRFTASTASNSHGRGRGFESRIAHHSGPKYTNPPQGNEGNETGNEMLKTDDVAKREGVGRKAVVRWCEAGLLRGAHKVQKGSREVWRIPPDYVVLAAPEGGYKHHKALWVKAQRNGTLSGKPIGQRTIDSYCYGLDKFWEKLDRLPDLQYMTPDQLQLALANFVIDYEGRNCFFGQREKVYKAVTSFQKYLVQSGLAPEIWLWQSRHFKPKRIFPERRTCLTEEQLIRLLVFNDGRKGLPAHDKAVNRMIVMLAAYAGLRREEICDLELGQVSLADGVIQVVDGKGYKNREVGIQPRLASNIADWIDTYRLKINTTSKAFLVDDTGKPLDRRCLNRRIKRLADAAKKAEVLAVDITPHGLRRTFATVLEEQGMPLSMLKNQLGHSDLKVTQSYLISDNRRAIDWLRKRQ